MGLYAAVARRRLGQLLGGDEGEPLFAQAEELMRAQAIVNPAAITDMLAPGW
jgi:hypothetical protein